MTDDQLKDQELPAAEDTKSRNDDKLLVSKEATPDNPSSAEAPQPRMLLEKKLPFDNVAFHPRDFNYLTTGWREKVELKFGCILKCHHTANRFWLWADSVQEGAFKDGGAIACGIFLKAYAKETQYYASKRREGPLVLDFLAYYTSDDFIAVDVRTEAEYKFLEQRAGQVPDDLPPPGVTYTAWCTKVTDDVTGHEMSLSQLLIVHEARVKEAYRKELTTAYSPFMENLESNLWNYWCDHFGHSWDGPQPLSLMAFKAQASRGLFGGSGQERRNMGPMQAPVMQAPALRRYPIVSGSNMAPEQARVSQTEGSKVGNSAQQSYSMGPKQAQVMQAQALRGHVSGSGSNMAPNQAPVMQPQASKGYLSGPGSNMAPKQAPFMQPQASKGSSSGSGSNLAPKQAPVAQREASEETPVKSGKKRNPPPTKRAPTTPASARKRKHDEVADEED
ncbi:uncharacterized protein RSE6_03009 [Rhynchosporium secalis]|uniref:Uncharacterized protein n=1 Tax=Rhynchosporium secalis TaxID=38038 RepID=A0A1E1M1P3_RHYSE|nr:uncharacterized protein RSE6_03009 [Rhynchosporium secalis]